MSNGGVVPTLGVNRRPRVVAVKFSLMRGKEIEEMSVARIKKTAAFDRHQIPKPEGVNDLRLGTPDRQLICQTCFNKKELCPGHMGHIELPYPVASFFYLDKWTVPLLRCLCFWCCRLIQKRENVERDRHSDLSRLDGLTRTRYLFKLLSGNTSKKPRQCAHCEGWQPEVIYRRKKSPMDIKLKWKKVIDRLTVGERDKAGRPFTSREVLEILEGGFPMEEKMADLEFLGFKPSISHPAAAIITHQPVPGAPVRPWRRATEGSKSSGQDDLTTKFNGVLKVCSDIEKKVLNGLAESQGKPPGSVDWHDPSVHVPREYTVELQAECATLYSSEIRGVKPKSSSRSNVPKKTLVERLRGKQGRFRGNLSGKRVNQCMRSVASPDCINVNEVGIPQDNVRRVYVAEPVQIYNRAEMQETVRRGPNHLLGAKYVVDHEQRRIFLNERNHKNLQVELGWKVCRYVRPEDYWLVNRQPTLHKGSIMAHRPRVLPYETFRLNLSVTTSYNADFDGDEINIHVPQSFLARVEAQELMSVEQQIISAQNNAPIISLVQDSRAGSHLCTLMETFFTQAQATQLLSQVVYCAPGRDNWSLPPPAIDSPVRLWTGKQIYTLMLPTTLSYSRQVRDLAVRQGQVAWMDPKERWVEFQRGEMLSGSLCGQTIGGSASGLVHHLKKIYGAKVTIRFLSDAQRLIKEFMGMRGFSVGIDDCLNPPRIQRLTDDVLTLYEAVVRVVDEAGRCLRLPPEDWVRRHQQEQQQQLQKQHQASSQKSTGRDDSFSPEEVQRVLNHLWDRDEPPPQKRLAVKQGNTLLVAGDPSRLAAQDEALENLLTGQGPNVLYPRHLPLELIDAPADYRADESPLTPGERVIDPDELEQFAWSLGNRVFGLLGRIDHDMVLTHQSDLKTMVDTKSKGNSFNRDQMEKALGQQSTERGMRIHLDGSSRVLNHDKHSLLVAAPSSVGYVRNGLTRGLTPWEMFFHSMGSREGLIDTAVKTSETGYIQRSMIKNMESLQARGPDGVVTNENGEVVQWVYGLDGMDPVHLEFVQARCLLVSDEQVRILLRWSAEERATMASLFHLAPEQEDREVQEILALRSDIIRKALHQLPIQPLKSTVQVPVHAERLIAHLRHSGKILLPSGLSATGEPREPFRSLEEYLDEVDTLCAQLARAPGVSAGPPISSRDTSRQSLVLRTELRSRKMLGQWGIDRTDWRVISDAIINRYFTSLVSPGDMVGVLAAMCIGEPATQMTLNFFHFSGFAAKNITLGMPRLKELIGTIKRCSKPLAHVFLREPFSSCPGGLQLARRALEYVSFPLATDGQKADVLWKPLFPREENHSSSQADDRDQMLLDLMLFKRGTSLNEDEWDQEWCRGWTRTGIDPEYDYCQRKLQANPPAGGGKIALVEDDLSDWVMHFVLDKKRLRAADLTPYEVGVCLQSYLGSHLALVEASETNMHRWHINVRLRGTKSMLARAKHLHPNLTEYQLKDIERCILANVQSTLLRSGVSVEAKPNKNDDGNSNSNQGDGGGGDDGISSSPSTASSASSSASAPSAAKVLGLAGLRGIRKANPVKIKVPTVNPSTGAVEDRDEWMLQTEGTALMALLGLPLVDATRTYSNDPREVMDVLGVRAATTVLADEIRNVISFDGTYVDSRHFRLAANTITHHGLLLAMSRHGIKEKTACPLVRCSYEETVEVLVESAMRGLVNPITNGSVTSNIYLGQTCPFGTGSVDILCDESELPPSTSARPDSGLSLGTQVTVTRTPVHTRTVPVSSMNHDPHSSSATPAIHHHHPSSTADADWDLDEPTIAPIAVTEVERMLRERESQQQQQLAQQQQLQQQGASRNTFHEDTGDDDEDTVEWNPWATAPDFMPSSPVATKALAPTQQHPQQHQQSTGHKRRRTSDLNHGEDQPAAKKRSII